MCGKMGNSEIDTIKNMMSMSVYYVIADCFDIDAMKLEPNNALDNDFHMTTEEKSLLSESITDMFNGHQLEFSTIHTVQDIVDQVIKTTMSDLIH